MSGHSPSYRQLEQAIADDRCLVLDGGMATELQRRGDLLLDEQLWGTAALFDAPGAVLDVHRAYAGTGCDVISTDTWSILSVAGRDWPQAARTGVRLARQAVADAGRTGACAVAFAISEEADPSRRHDDLRRLLRVLADDPPDLILLETLTLVRDPGTYDTLELLLGSGLPVWLSFRRCRHGVCGVFGQHWGPPEGGLFGRAAARFEQLGAGALLINCLPVDHVPGMLSWLRDFTALPLGVYPNLGHQSGNRWRFDPATDPAAYAELALRWRAEGAQIVGGCCGVGPEHIGAAADALAGTHSGRERPAPAGLQADHADTTPARPWRDRSGRVVHPMPFPKLEVDPGVFVPTTGSYLVWKALYDGRLGAGLHCADVGCGCGILSVQLALNGATAVHAIDVEQAAVENTLANAGRNGVGGVVTGQATDLYQWEPDARFDLVVASLFQMPVDPYQEPAGHRPLDYWGRSLIDHFVRLLPRLLDAGGVAYLMQLSIVGQAATQRQLERAGFESRVVDFSFFPFGPLFEQNREQIDRVEQLSDAYHLRIATTDVMIAYLLEITRAGAPAA